MSGAACISNSMDESEWLLSWLHKQSDPAGAVTDIIKEVALDPRKPNKQPCVKELPPESCARGIRMGIFNAVCNHPNAGVGSALS